MLRQVLPVVFLTAEGLAKLGGQRKMRRGYRGLAGVRLDRSLYSVGKIAVFAPFTSKSEDQSVAVDFAEKANEQHVAVFTMHGRSCNTPSPPWCGGVRKALIALSAHLPEEAPKDLIMQLFT
eukprot:gene43952-57873_t